MEKRDIRVWVLGPHGSGKTTFIKIIDETEPVSVTLNPDWPPKDKVTLYFDFGQIAISKSLTVFLFGPSDWTTYLIIEQFDFEKRVDGFIILIDSSDYVSVHTVTPILDKVRSYKDIPYTIIDNNQNHLSPVTLDQLREILQLSVIEVIVPCAAIEKEIVKAALLSVRVKLLDKKRPQTIGELRQPSA